MSRLKRFASAAVLALSLSFAAGAAGAAASARSVAGVVPSGGGGTAWVRPVAGDPLTGSGAVNRTLLTYDELTSPQQPAAPVDDGAFTLPAGAAAPSHTFEGNLTLLDPGAAGGFSDVLGCPPGACGTHLPPLRMDFVQNGSWLIPAHPGLVITGDAQPGSTYNLIVSPGRAWNEDSDHGLTRASLPFTLVDRNQNCTHNGELTFLFDATTISQVRYQVTKETCALAQFNMWGQLSASYTPGRVPDARALKDGQAKAVSDMIPIRPLSQLATDYPSAGLDLSVFGGPITPSAMTAYGVVYRGIDYVADAAAPNPGCQTRYGTYAFCDEMVLPSYSTAKSSFASLAMAWLEREYGPAVPDLLLRSYIPQMAASPNWNTAPVTFNDAADMATGNYDSQLYEQDENGPITTDFLLAEPFGTATSGKLGDALAYPHHPGEQGYTWVYHTVDQFLLAQAETGFLQSRRGPSADLLHAMWREVYSRLHLNGSASASERTDNAAVQGENPVSGRPFGAYGMFWTVDDVAKLATLFQDGGAYDGRQLVDRGQMLAAMQRLSADRGVGAEGANYFGNGDGTVAAGGFRYSNGLWAYPTTTEVPGCPLRIPFMSGYGGITIAMMPDGATYYYFSDANQFLWADTIAQLNKLAPMCAATTTSLAVHARGHSALALRAVVASPARAWAPTGTVRFEDDGTAISPNIQLDAQGGASFTSGALGAGEHRLTAVYSPDFSDDTGIDGSPAITTLSADCSYVATTCSVTSTAGMRVGDTIVMGTGAGTDDEHVITALTPTTISWVGNFQYVDHAPGERAWVQDTAGGGFAASASPAVTVGVRAP